MKKNRILLLLALVVAAGIFLRTYHFGDWLFFQGDQARDAILVGNAVERGPGWLPLLGPRAGGTALRLGPVFYYFQYLSGTLFHSTDPHVFAYPDLLFGILAVPLLFFFLREFFSAGWSLALAFGYAVCFFAVQYSRFAWNPNSLPFFNLLFFYAILKFLKTGENRKKKHWLVAAAVAYAVASQLHFVSLLSLPAAAILIVLAYQRIERKISFNSKKTLEYALIIFFVLLIFYLPVILSEIWTDWNNSLNFLSSLGTKSSDSSLSTLAAKELFNFSKYASIILSGVINARKTVYQYMGAFFFLAFALSTLVVLKRRCERTEKLFILVIWAWFVSYTLSYLSVASSLQPRHFLVFAPLFFVMWGIVIAALVPAASRSLGYNAAAIALLLIPAAANAYSVKTWFAELTASQSSISSFRKSEMLKSVGGESWWHLENTAKYIRADCKKSELVIVPPKKAYQSLVAYAMGQIGETRHIIIAWDSLGFEPDACYYAVYFSKNNFAKHLQNSSGIDKLYSKFFGDMAVTRISLANPIEAKSKTKNLAEEKTASTLVEEAINDIDQATESENDPGASTTGEVSANAQSAPHPAAENVMVIAPDSKIGHLLKFFQLPLQFVARKPHVFWKDLLADYYTRL